MPLFLLFSLLFRRCRVVVAVLAQDGARPGAFLDGQPRARRRQRQGLAAAAPGHEEKYVALHFQFRFRTSHYSASYTSAVNA